VHDLLLSARAVADTEPRTLQWYAFKLGDEDDGKPGEFLAFNVFADAAARDVHLNGKIDRILAENSDLFVAKPRIQPVDVIAHKIRNTAPRQPLFGAQIIMVAKPNLGGRIKRILTVCHLSTLYIRLNRPKDHVGPILSRSAG
jgi:quinol monooxygenase YgiN